MKSHSTRRNSNIYWEVYAQNTSIHGFRELFDAQSLPGKIFWISVLIVSAVFTAILVYRGVSNFLKEPVSTTVVRSENGAIHLDLLFCPARWVNAEKLRQQNITIRHLFFALSHLQQYSSPRIECKQLHMMDSVVYRDFVYELRSYVAVLLQEKFSVVGLTTNPEYATDLLQYPDVLEFFTRFLTAEQCGTIGSLVADPDNRREIVRLLWNETRLNILPSLLVYEMQERNISRKLTAFFERLHLEDLSYDPIYVVIRQWQGYGRSNLSTEQDQQACSVAPLVCPTNKNDLLRLWPRFFRSNGLAVSMGELETIHQLASLKDDDMSVFKYVQKLFEAEALRANQTNALSEEDKERSFTGYKKLLVEVFITDIYSNYTPKHHQDYTPFSSFAVLDNFDDYVTMMSLAHYGRPGKINSEVFAALNISRNDIPVKHFQLVRDYAKQNSKYLRYLRSHARDNSEQSLRSYFAGTETLDEKLQLASEMLHQALRDYSADVREEYTAFLESRNWTNSFSLLRAVAVDPSQFITALSVSDNEIIYPVSWKINTDLHFTQHGACYRFDIDAQSERQDNIQDKLLPPDFSDKIRLVMYYAYNSFDLGSVDRDYDLVYFGKQAFEHSPAEGVRIDHNWSYYALVSQLNVSITQLNFQEKINRMSDGCRQDLEATYTVRNCIADCNNHFAPGINPSATSKNNKSSRKCYVARETPLQQPNAPHESCSYFYDLESVGACGIRQSSPPAIDYSAIRKCYADCHAPCSQWHLKATYGPSKLSHLLGYGYNFDEKENPAGFDELVNQVAANSTRPVAIPDGWSMDQLWRLEYALTKNDKATEYTLLHVDIDNDVTMYIEHLTFTWDALFGIVGGQIGLVMGASVLSFVQMGYLFYVAWKQHGPQRYSVHDGLSIVATAFSVPPAHTSKP